MEGLINEIEEKVARRCLEHALSSGADKARVTLSKNLTELYGTLNGKLDKVSRSMDRALSISIFANGRYGNFSANRLEEKELFPFIEKAVKTVGTLAKDPCRDLPSPDRQVKGALTGDELGLLDPACEDMGAESRRALALQASVWPSEGKGWNLISEEGEYSGSVEHCFCIDSGGLEALHGETCFSYGVA